MTDQHKCVQERDSEIELLRQQLGEFKVEARVGAAAIGASDGVAVMDMAGGGWAGRAAPSWNAPQQASSTR